MEKKPYDAVTINPNQKFIKHFLHSPQSNQIDDWEWEEEEDMTDNTPLAIPQMMKQGFRVEEMDYYVRIILHGQFKGIEHLSDFLMQIYDAAQYYDMAEVWIHSPGGNAETTMHIMDALELFDTIVTIGTGVLASAGSMVWLTGDIKVLSKRTSLMFHRETFGYVGKTEEMSSHVEHSKTFFDEIFPPEFFSDFLTEEETERMKLTEIWKTSSELLETGKCISFRDYCMGNNIASVDPQTTIVEINGDMFSVNKDGWAVEVGKDMSQYPEIPMYKWIDLQLGSPNPRYTMVANMTYDPPTEEPQKEEPEKNQSPKKKATPKKKAATKKKTATRKQSSTNKKTDNKNKTAKK